MKTKKHTSSPVNKTPERDLYQLVTDRVIEAIEKGVAPWKRPWRSVRTHSGDPMMPVNALTRSAYRGINVLLLWLAAEEAGYSSNCWLTYRQAQALGGQVRKGEKSTMAVIYKSWHKQDEDENGNRIFDAEGNPVMVDVPVLKANPLFNVEQCDGLSLPEAATTVTENGANDTLNAVADRVLTMVNACGVKIHSLPQDRAYYTPVFDRIVLPLSSQFTSAEDYWSTLLHELVHSTGHAKRLNREGIVSSGGSYGDERYAFEELIAEMGSAFLCAQLGVTGNVQHENYIGAWLKILRADKKALFSACRQAREATEYLLSVHDTPAEKAA